MKIELNDLEWAELKKPIKGPGGFQNFLTKLKQRAGIRGGNLELSAEDIQDIQQHAFGYGNGGFEGRLRRIFERHLGENLRG